MLDKQLESATLGPLRAIISSRGFWRPTRPKPRTPTFPTLTHLANGRGRSGCPVERLQPPLPSPAQLVRQLRAQLRARHDIGARAHALQRGLHLRGAWGGGSVGIWSLDRTAAREVGRKCLHARRERWGWTEAEHQSRVPWRQKALGVRAPPSVPTHCTTANHDHRHKRRISSKRAGATQQE